MADKSPRHSMSKKSGKSIKEKRVETQGQGRHDLADGPPDPRQEALSAPRGAPHGRSRGRSSEEHPAVA